MAGGREPYWAHSCPKQPLGEHLARVAELARRFGEEAGPQDPDFAEAAYLAGLLHDYGKYGREFQDYLLGRRPKGQATRHKQAGAVLAAQKFGRPDLAFVIAGHHGGLPDKSALQDLPAVARKTRPAAELLPAGREDCLALAEAVGRPPHDFRGPRSCPELDLYVRLLFSCLVDADWLDTAGYGSRGEGRAEAGPPPLAAGAMLESLLEHVARRAAAGVDPDCGSSALLVRSRHGFGLS